MSLPCLSYQSVMSHEARLPSLIRHVTFFVMCYQPWLLHEPVTFSITQLVSDFFTVGFHLSQHCWHGSVNRLCRDIIISIYICIYIYSQVDVNQVGSSTSDLDSVYMGFVAIHCWNTSPGTCWSTQFDRVPDWYHFSAVEERGPVKLTL